jgi:putative ABC transport system permease protein
MRPRWFKVVADLWGNKVRTGLVVLSIAVGLFAVGMITTVHTILTEDMRSGYAMIQPANIILYVSDFDDNMVERVQRVQGVADAMGTRSFDLMVRGGGGDWTRIRLEAFKPGADEAGGGKRINQVSVEEGVWPPQNRHAGVERNKRASLLDVGGTEGLLTIELKLPSGKLRRLPVTGVLHDLSLGAGEPGGFFIGPAHAYITRDTLEWLGQPNRFNRLLVTADAAAAPEGRASLEDEAYLREVAARVSDAVEDEGGIVFTSQVRGSRDHPNAAYVDAMTGVLYMLGALVVFLSTFLITNTLSALLNQQSVQIAIMKTVGARSGQVTVIYMALILVFSALALALSLPLSRQAAFGLLAFLADGINFNVLAYRTAPTAVLLQLVIALVAPQAAGIVPILRGSRQKVQEALSGGVTAPGRERRAPAGRNIQQAGRRFFRIRSRALLISLRNTFRHKGRLALTLITLMLGGAVFIATFNVRASMADYIARIGRYFLADVNLTLDRDYRIVQIEEALRGVEGATRVEGWAVGRSELLLEDDRSGDAVSLLAPPSDSQLIEPILLQGRWILPGDRGAIVLSERFLSAYPGLRVGDPLQLRVNGKDTRWVVVGFFQLAGKSAGFVAYTNAEHLAPLIGQANRAITFRITAERPKDRPLTRAEQEALGARLESTLQARGYGVTEVSAGRSLVEDTAAPLDTLTTFLLIMAVLTAIVGSIGLMGTMSMNVLDRTREIGVLRAVGASDRVVMRMVIQEGVVIGAISWALGLLLSVPISKALSDIIHLAIFDAQADFAFTLEGPLLWLGLVLILSVMASVLPARAAARLTIREALAYE